MDINKIHHLYDLIQYKLNHFDKEKENKMFVEDVHINDLNNLVDKDIDHQHLIREHKYLQTRILLIKMTIQTNHYIDMDFLDKKEYVFHKILPHVQVHKDKFPLELELKYKFHYVDMENDYKMLYCVNHVHKMDL
jgi:hypothetical protein